MRFTVDFSSLGSALKLMGARPIEINLRSADLDPLTILQIELEQGIEVELKDIETNVGGLLGYKGHQVVLYIPDQGRYMDKVLEDPTQGKKFHVADCVTLRNMKSAGRFERYVVRNGLAPEFRVHGFLKNGEIVEDRFLRLRVCINCLKKLNYRGYNGKRPPVKFNVLKEFSLERFFATYSSYFEHTPTRSAAMAGGNHYPSNWKEISLAYRKSKNWTCEQCQVDLSANKSLLHVHHKNGNRDNSREANLAALCKDCHSKQPMHGSLDTKRSERQLIQSLRNAQRIYSEPARSSHDAGEWDEAMEYADPALFGLLDELRRRAYEVPTVGYDVVAPGGRVIYSNAELAWPNLKEVVVLGESADDRELEKAGWRIFYPQALLDELQGV